MIPPVQTPARTAGANSAGGEGRRTGIETMAEPFEFHVSTMGRYSAKVAGRWLDKFNAKRGVREVETFRTRAAAEKAAREHLTYIRRMFA